MTTTGERFDQYAPRESQVFSQFLDDFDRKPGFLGIKQALATYEAHPDGIEEYDIRCQTERGYVTIDVQESEDFAKWGDLRIDYVSSYTPVWYRTRNISQFKRDARNGRVTVDKWGKVVDPKADFLVVEFHNGKPLWQIYDLGALHDALGELEQVGQFITNTKRGENWGSAFLAVPENHKILQNAKPDDLEDVLRRAKPQG